MEAHVGTKAWAGTDRNGDTGRNGGISWGGDAGRAEAMVDLDSETKQHKDPGTVVIDPGALGTDQSIEKMR